MYLHCVLKLVYVEKALDYLRFARGVVDFRLISCIFAWFRTLSLDFVQPPLLRAISGQPVDTSAAAEQQERLRANESGLPGRDQPRARLLQSRPVRL